MRQLQKPELIEFLKKYIHPSGNDDHSVRKLSVHIVSSASDKEALGKHIEKVVDTCGNQVLKPCIINDLGEFKQSCGLYALPKPFISKKKLARL